MGLLVARIQASLYQKKEVSFYIKENFMHFSDLKSGKIEKFNLNCFEVEKREEKLKNFLY